MRAHEGAHSGLQRRHARGLHCLQGEPTAEAVVQGRVGRPSCSTCHPAGQPLPSSREVEQRVQVGPLLRPQRHVCPPLRQLAEVHVAVDNARFLIWFKNRGERKEGSRQRVKAAHGTQPRCRAVPAAMMSPCTQPQRRAAHPWSPGSRQMVQPLWSAPRPRNPNPRCSAGGGHAGWGGRRWQGIALQVASCSRWRAALRPSTRSRPPCPPQQLRVCMRAAWPLTCGQGSRWPQTSGCPPPAPAAAAASAPGPWSC